VLRDVSRVYNLITASTAVMRGADVQAGTAHHAVAPAVGDRLMREVADMSLTDPQPCAVAPTAT
jgi:hypothetical protein